MQNDPRWRVTARASRIAEDWRQLVVRPPLIVDAVRAAPSRPRPKPFEIGDVSGQIYKFVVWATTRPARRASARAART